MKVNTSRGFHGNHGHEVATIQITIGDKRYTLEEDIEGRLQIRASGKIAVYPNVSNVISINSEGDQW